MALDFRSDPAAELTHFAGKAGLGVDGVFVDCPATAVAWRQLEYALVNSTNSTAQSDDQKQPRGTCSTVEWCTAVVFLSVAVGWAGARYLVVWITAAQQYVFPRYRRLSDETASRMSEMTGRS